MILNAIGPLSLKELRGKVVLLDFWTFCCANCLHVIDELRALERDFADDPACYLDRQDWGVPFRLSEQGEISLQLMLPG